SDPGPGAPSSNDPSSIINHQSDAEVQMKIALGTDHAGYEYKERIKQRLIEKGHEVTDFGTHSSEPCDYPDFIYPAALAVGKGQCDRAIVMGGSGNGETIVANKVRGVRCAVCWNEELARLSRAHNNANVISIGARTVSIETALKMVDIWLSTPFDAGRHTERLRKLAELDRCSL
ncbi:MAG: ribose 5-phosphate isomerase B, partial [Phycisphaerales bacterium]